MTDASPQPDRAQQETIRNMWVHATRIPLLPVVEHQPFHGDPVIGPLGDHKKHELTVTGTDRGYPVVVPARKFVMDAIVSGLAALDSTLPLPLRGSQTPSYRLILARLSTGAVAHSTETLPRSLVSVNFNESSPVVQTFSDLNAPLTIHEGRWDLLAKKTQTRSLKWRQFLALDLHPSAFMWTQMPASASYHRPSMVNILDHSAHGLADAMDTSVLVPSDIHPFLSKRVVFFPFAARTHTTHSAEFRWQASGHCLVYALVWKEWGDVTPKLREYRASMLSVGNWTQCIYGTAHSPGKVPTQVSHWVREVCNPHDVLYFPPGTFVLEYSLGTSVSTEGDFLPYACLPMMRPLSTPPTTYLLLAMALSAVQDYKNGRAAEHEVRVLHALATAATPLAWPPSTDPWKSKIKEFQDKSNKALKAIHGLFKLPK
ncbi:hypothetical protein FRB90_008105 [Tulasnella sp. 427]|nr:hypothetical protein FRB90_008105 [Tulasnella sp. 427]